MGWFSRKVVPTVASMSPKVPVASYALYVRGRTLSPGAAIYGYGGDVAATAMFPLSGSGQIVPGPGIRTRFQTVTPTRQISINGQAQGGVLGQFGQAIALGIVDDPGGVGSGGVIINGGGMD